MKRLTVFAMFMLLLTALGAQQCYWVFLTDKAGSQFDPYTYFDTKAIERYRACGADLNDITNYPLAEAYVSGVSAVATEVVGCSRWMNAIGVMATASEVEAIERLPYVARVQAIESNMQLASVTVRPEEAEPTDSLLTDQLVRMQGGEFRSRGIDGKGMRIAVFDGGFPKVDTHKAFEHLRADGRILKTWNFPNRKENVYGWNSHGTMTLSCIAGRKEGRDLGLATGAEFLLARTEVESEPFKEEVWWQMAVEWADRNGANIISSSLGYGKDRYYTRDMDGQSYVAKAGNLAARKGILVCASAGNEADDRTWRRIVTPSDADSVICVGGIEHNLTEYNHISFASYGPTADGRQKPNVCAFAHAWAASPSKNDAYQMVYGTSFSCPLVAGFAACAWQASPGKTAMQMFDLLQRSADLYPYCDYAFGYGVPQSSYFFTPEEEHKPTFRFETQSVHSVSVIPLERHLETPIFYKDVDKDGSIIRYGKMQPEVFDTNMSLDFNSGHKLVVHFDGYTAEYTFRESTASEEYGWARLRSLEKGVRPVVKSEERHSPRKDDPHEKHFTQDFYFMFGLPIGTGSDELETRLWSPAKRLGMRWMYGFTKAYALGVSAEWGSTAFRFNKYDPNFMEKLLEIDDYCDLQDDDISKRKSYVGEVTLELFQRVRIRPLGIRHKGLHWDLGVWGSWGYSSYRVKVNFPKTGEYKYSSLDIKMNNPYPLDDYRWNYGVSTRLTYDAIGLYARYRLNDIGRTLDDEKVLLPRLEVGLQLMF